jgi:predicted AlkP superfamily phosphohydrolase/phosphomutase
LFRDAALSYFAEVDRAIAELTAWAGTTGNVMVVSDHGFGPWEKTLNLNLLLESWGYLRLPAVSRLTRSGVVAGAGQQIARRVVPRKLLHALKAQVGRGISWPETKAFASHVAEQGIHVNATGDVPEGVLDERAAEVVEAEILERLAELVDPDDGLQVVDRTERRADVLWGDHARRAPRLFPFCRDQRYELSDTVAAGSPLTDHRDRPWGYHHIDGIFVAAGPDIATGAREELRIVDVLPTVFHVAGLPVPSGLDGRVASHVLGGKAASTTVQSRAMAVSREQGDEYPFSAEEESAIEDSLRGLGYIE